jgi:membrane fusion protein, macrolide-specific efflux system
VPSQALTGSTVTVVDKNGKQSSRQVQTGVVGDSTTQIVSGLKAGESVVVRSATAGAGGAAGQGANQLNSALSNRAGGGGLGGGRLGGGGFGGGFGGGPPVQRGP